ncbi:hypothetical protein LPW36_01930 [Jinshanibacter sp. LJY008]|uniref:Phage protein Gp138 N-terminal domain-containing protein n=1 Tax=Limnobaculum eriocheiris TaxID=2897391 RepID=A0A9X1SIV0_9GAMM|nr:Gp138 family membrane-puncturing spike protein [Limnobaculum eriocheiris]MCD1124803.1 hypothetical protein [Limnobaculum eriocheiris]
MSEQAKPSRDPANDGSMVGMLQQVFDKLLQKIDDMLPAVVMSYDRDSNMATVHPLVSVVTTEGEPVSRAQLTSVPAMQFGGGGFVLNFPLKAGDLGWIKANDRDISLYLQSFGESMPNTKRKHSFEDGVFIPNVLRDFIINAEDKENAVLQSLDGSVRISLFPDKIKLTAATVEVDGNFKVTGTSELAGQVTATAGATIAGIEFRTHKHTGVDTGTGTSGGPTS